MIYLSLTEDVLDKSNKIWVFLSNIQLILSFIICVLYRISIPGNTTLPMDNQHHEIIMILKSS